MKGFIGATIVISVDDSELCPGDIFGMVFYDVEFYILESEKLLDFPHE